jgi:hypothetical protein
MFPNLFHHWRYFKYLSKESIIDMMKTWEDEVLEEAAENLGYEIG